MDYIFPSAFLLVGLLMVFADWLREQGYLSLGKYRDGIGWWFSLQNKAQMRGVRLQWEKYPIIAGQFMVRKYPARLCWPRIIRVRLHKLTILLYLGG